MDAMPLAAIMGPIYGVLGLSFLLYAKQWQKLMAKLSKDHFLLLPLMFLYMVLGLIVVSLYNVWEWNIWLLVTLTGWGMLGKAVFYFLAPESLIKPWLGMAKPAGALYFGGLVSLIIGVALSYYTYFV